MLFYISESYHECLPQQSSGRKGYGYTEIMKMTEKSKMVCNIVPPAKPNTTYVVNLNSVSFEDIRSDDSGAYLRNSISTTYLTYDKFKRTWKAVPSKGKVVFGEYSHIYKRYYSYKKESGSKRIIYWVLQANGTRLPNAVVQYIGLHFFPQPYGAKPGSEAYIRTLPSTLQRIRAQASTLTPKEPITDVEKQYGNVMTAPPQGLVRDRGQVYNVRRPMEVAKQQNTGMVPVADLNKLYTLMNAEPNVLRAMSIEKTDAGGFVRTFTCPENMCSMIRKYCQVTSHVKTPLGIDMTYNVGDYYTTTLTLKHPMLQCKKTGSYPTMFAGVMTSMTRNVDDYRYLAQQIKIFCKVETLIYGTDGEMPLEKGFEEIFPIGNDGPNIKLRCFDHVKKNALDKLDSLHVEEKEKRDIILQMLGSEYEGVRKEGLVDMSEDNFDVAYETLKCNWPKEFVAYVEERRGVIRPLKDTWRMCMSAEVRTAAGLGCPPNKFDNQRTEAMHNVMKHITKHVFVNQCKLLEDVQEKMVKPQHSEVVKSLFGHGEYRLRREYGGKAVTERQWNAMSVEQRELKVKSVFGFTSEIHKEELGESWVKLSISPESCEDKLNDIPIGVLSRIWQEAENIINRGQIHDMANGDICVVSKRDTHQLSKEKGSLKCGCDHFKSCRGICGHVLAVHQKRKQLNQFIDEIPTNRSVPVATSRGSGNKPGKKPRRGRNRIIGQPVTTVVPLGIRNLNVKPVIPFSKPYHNETKFTVTYFDDLEPGKTNVCMSCGVEFRQGMNAPHDFGFAHQERWEYPERCSTTGELVRKFSMKSTTKYYHAKRSCILKRHPYFWNELIAITDVKAFGKERMALLEEEFGCAENLF